jgi:hypothetical protein
MIAVMVLGRRVFTRIAKRSERDAQRVKRAWG